MFLSVKERDVIRKKSTINSLKNFLSRGISQELKSKLEEEEEEEEEEKEKEDSEEVDKTT